MLTLQVMKWVIHITWELPALISKQYVVEVKKNENREVPPNWLILGRSASSLGSGKAIADKFFRTKSATRYHPPEVKKKLQERAQLKEALDGEANKAFSSFLDEIAQIHYGVLRSAVNNLAVADCLLSLARVAIQENYVRPQFTDDDRLEIIEGKRTKSYLVSFLLIKICMRRSASNGRSASIWSVRP